VILGPQLHLQCEQLIRECITDDSQYEVAVTQEEEEIEEK
jgi:hypothetical protein